MEGINLDVLTRPFSPEQIRQREGRGGKTLDYIETHAVITRLNEAFGGAWSFEVLDFKTMEGEIVVHGKLTAGGQVKAQFGSADIHRARGEDGQKGAPISIGDDLKAAASDALKKCATLFGVGLHLYDKPQAAQRPTQQRPAQAGRPEAGTAAERPAEARQRQRDVSQVAPPPGQGRPGRSRAGRRQEADPGPFTFDGGHHMARGSIIKRKNGYTIVYDAGMKWDEKKGQWVRNQKWEKVSNPDTLKHAQKLLTDKLNQIDKGEYVEPSHMKFEAFKDVWMKKYAEGQVRPSTQALYLSLFRTHLIPAFGGMELAKIGVEDIQGFKSAKLAEGLAPESVKGVLRVLRQMLNHAVDWGYLRHNPARKVKAPKVPRREMDSLNPEECRAFLDHAPRGWYAFFLTALTTGLRFNELLAMKWANLDWNRGVYFVKETLTRKTEVKDRGFAPTKTEGSTQSVDLTPTCQEALRAHRARQAEEKLKAGESYQDQDMIFATPQGLPWIDNNVLYRVFRPALKSAGLRQIRFHDLRHTCASLLIHQGESPKYIQKQMRHASIQMTFDRYGHLFPDANREAARRLDATLFSSQTRKAESNDR